MGVYGDDLRSRSCTDDPYLQYDSEDEREGVAAKAGREKKLISQNTKKAMKNRAALPRTAGLRTLSELTTEMTKAGLDPSRIQERAELLAKVAGAKRKHLREEEEAQMDVDEDAKTGGEGEDEWMDVDGEEAPRLKKAKANTGAVVTNGARHPRSNRQLAGMRDGAVSSLPAVFEYARTDWLCYASLASIKSNQVAESRTERTQHAGTRGGERSRYQDQNGGRHSADRPACRADHAPLQPKHLFAGKRKMCKTDRR